MPSEFWSSERLELNCSSWISCLNHYLVGGFNPFHQYARQIGSSFPQFSGWKFQKNPWLATTQLLPRPRPHKNPFKSMRVPRIQPISESLHQLVALDKMGNPRWPGDFFEFKRVDCNSVSLILICWSVVLCLFQMFYFLLFVFVFPLFQLL